MKKIFILTAIFLSINLFAQNHHCVYTTDVEGSHVFDGYSLPLVDDDTIDFMEITPDSGTVAIVTVDYVMALMNADTILTYSRNFDLISAHYGDSTTYSLSEGTAVEQPNGNSIEENVIVEDITDGHKVRIWSNSGETGTFKIFYRGCFNMDGTLKVY